VSALLPGVTVKLAISPVSGFTTVMFSIVVIPGVARVVTRKQGPIVEGAAKDRRIIGLVGIESDQSAQDKWLQRRQERQRNAHFAGDVVDRCAAQRITNRRERLVPSAYRNGIVVAIEGFLGSGVDHNQNGKGECEQARFARFHHMPL